MQNKGHVYEIYLPYASILSTEKQKCEKDIEQASSSNVNNINLDVLGKFYTD